jgi:hypothetical protein
MIVQTSIVVPAIVRIRHTDPLPPFEVTVGAHPLVDQLRFARSEFVRGLDGVTEEDALRRFGPINSIGWMVGHLANQEHLFWVRLAQRKNLAPGLNELVGTGRPASTPGLDDMWAMWRTVTAAADAYLDTITPAIAATYLRSSRGPVAESVGTLLLRSSYHYWFHTGEAAAIRQLLGHVDLPEFVGDMTEAAYRPEL